MTSNEHPIQGVTWNLSLRFIETEVWSEPYTAVYRRCVEYVLLYFHAPYTATVWNWGNGANLHVHLWHSLAWWLRLTRDKSHAFSPFNVAVDASGGHLSDRFWCQRNNIWQGSPTQTGGAPNRSFWNIWLAAHHFKPQSRYFFKTNTPLSTLYLNKHSQNWYIFNIWFKSIYHWYLPWSTFDVYIQE